MTEKPRALVTGATGYIGSHVARALAASGWAVAGLTRKPVSAAGAADSNGIRLYSVSESFATVRDAVESAAPNIVFHLAALSIANPSPADVDSMIRSNVLLLAQVAEAMRETGSRSLINTSTYWQFASDGSVRPLTLYAATKQAAESIIDFHVGRGLRAVTIILHDVYGPIDPRPKLLSQLAAIDPDAAPMDLSAGTQIVDYVYIDDVARAFVDAATRLLTNPSAAHERFVVRGQRPLALRSVVELLATTRGVTLPLNWGGRPSRDYDIQVPWLGGLPVPGWRPEVTLEEGLARLVRSVGSPVRATQDAS
jgi:nucleoside-diphosphate-sugar epimerase